jgi:Zn-dependent protease
MPTRRGSFKIFSLAGISVYVHWLWFLVAVYSIQYRTHEYSSMIWNVLEYLTLFLIVLTHEFGHQLACRSVGGQTHDIVLWPLGGVAFVSPPQRPGAQLWSIAAGPLVNVVLVPVFSVLVSISSHLGWYDTHPDAYDFLHNVWWINVVLLVFNLMPVYPIDGGQILRSLLWFVFGRANSLLAASIIGFVGVTALIGLAIFAKSIWLGVMAAFILMNCWSGLKQARALARIAKLPRREGFACPSCKTAPPLGELWRCGKCGKAFDTFLTQATCPHCGVQYSVTQCLDCGTNSPIAAWSTSSAEFGVRSAE